MDPPPVRYVKTSDGYDIAYAVAGEGRPFVFMPLRRNHIQIAWEDSPTKEWLEGLASRFRLVQYDSRGQGLSTRGIPDDFQPSDYECDLETLVNHLELPPFILMSHALFGHVAVRYAIAHPGRVHAMVLCAVRPALPTIRWLEMARQNWNLFLFQQVGGTGLTPEQRRRAIERLQLTTNQRDFVTCTGAFLNSSIEADLRELSIPTLVLHPRDFPVFEQEESVKVASSVPGARMITTDGAVAPGEASDGLRALDAFLRDIQDEQAPKQPAVLDDLSARELEVLKLLAAGKSNQQIADELVISLNTVRRHVSNIFDKTGVANRAQATAYAKDHDLT